MDRPGEPGFRGNQHCKGTGSFSREDDAFILANYRSVKDGYDKVGMSTFHIAQHLNRNRNSIVSRYHILMGRRRRGGLYYYYGTEDKRYQRVEPVVADIITPSMPKTSFEDLDPGKYDD